VETLARDADAQPALGVANDAATDGDGYLWEDVDGNVLYADGEHRRGITSSLEINACHMDAGAVWVRNLDGLVNDLRLRWGPEPQAEVAGTDDDAIATRGRYGASITTTIANEVDALARVQLTLVRQADPSWVLSGVTIHLGYLANMTASTAEDAALTAALLGLDKHDLITVTGLPAGSPYTTALLFVEGWAESIAWGAWSIGLVVSDYCRTSAVPHWDDVDPAWLWDTVDPDLLWDDTTCLPPPAPVGRWDDVPASTRWDAVPAVVTWDTWVG
jgi:hypothetical protein